MKPVWATARNSCMEDRPPAHRRELQVVLSLDFPWLTTLDGSHGIWEHEAKGRALGGEHCGCKTGAFPVLLWWRWQIHTGPDSSARCLVLGTTWVKMLLNLINWVCCLLAGVDGRQTTCICIIYVWLDLIGLQCKFLGQSQTAALIQWLGEVCRTTR